MKIHVLTIAPTGVLLVFFTDGECWQFRVLSLAGVVFGELLLLLARDISRALARLALA